VPSHDSRLWGPVPAAVLGVALAGGCAVYDVPTLAGAPTGADGGSNGFGRLHDGGESGGSPADPDGWGGQPASLAVDAGQAGAIDGDDDVGGARSGEAAGASGGSRAAGAQAGAAGSWGGESQEGNGGTAGASGGGGWAAGSTSCAAGWRSQSACEQCATQTQPDLRACAVILDCYVSKSCGPSSCASTDQKCGPNVLQEGAAAYSIAQEVYTCLCQ
jgi:hypothetical protein